MSLKENSSKTNSSEDEIDISKLFISIGRGIGKTLKSIGKLVFLFLDKLFSNAKLIIALVILGTLLGIGYYSLIKPYYESRMTLSSAYYRGQFLSNSIQNLNRLCAEGNYNVLSNLLNIPVNQAKTLRRIELEQVVSPRMQFLMSMYKNDEVNKRRLDSLVLNQVDSTFQIKVQVFDTTTLVGLDTILVNFIKSNKFVNKRIAIERKNLLNRKAKLIRESKNLDTLKRYIAESYIAHSSGKDGTNVTLNDKETNPIDIYREDFRLYDQQLKIDRLLFINSEIEIIDRFITFGKPASGTIYKNAAKGAVGGLLVGFLYVFYLILRDGVRRFRTIVDE